MPAPALPYGSELDVVQENEGRKVMTLKLRKQGFEEKEQSVMEFVGIVVDVNQKMALIYKNGLSSPCTWHRCIAYTYARPPWRRDL